MGTAPRGCSPFADDFERRFVGQGSERRTVEQTLDLAWELLARRPALRRALLARQVVMPY
jgi:vacuolar-type H+-ATPase subunit B/Vma2